RAAEWTSPTGRTVRIHSTRLVSLSQRAVVAFRYEVEPVGTPARVVVQSELVANEPLPESGGDPRAAAALRSALASELDDHYDHGAVLVHSTNKSGLRIAAAMDHVVEGPPRTDETVES